MGWLFGRGKKNDDMDVQSLLERARGDGDTDAHTSSAPSTPSQPPVIDGSHGFSLTVEDVFSIAGSGTVVTGRVDSGVVSKGSFVAIDRDGRRVATVEVSA